MTDTQIIECIKSGKDDKALVALYKYFPVIKKMIKTKSGSAEDAKDMYQDALIIFHKKIMEGNFVLTSKIDTYLFSVCNFLWMDELKRRNKKPQVALEEKMENTMETDLNEALENERRSKLAEKIISELGDKCKELLLLFYSGVMKLKDIATKMGYASEASAKNQKYKCIESAKKKLLEIENI